MKQNAEQITVQDHSLRINDGGDYTLKPYQQNVTIKCPAAETVNVTLPPAAECTGYTITTRCISIGAAGTINIIAEGWASDTLADAAKVAVYHSDGFGWIQIFAN
jgi:hypothetical protein